jgi:hypothetical protein
MKGLFVYQQEAPFAWRKTGADYEFVAYNYGPCSFQVYDDLATLQRAGLVETKRHPGYEWNYYGLSPAGRALAERIRERWDSRVIDYLARIKDAFSRMSFASLLHAVYSKYPDYARNSVLRS